MLGTYQTATIEVVGGPNYEQRAPVFLFRY